VIYKHLQLCALVEAVLLEPAVWGTAAVQVHCSAEARWTRAQVAVTASCISPLGRAAAGLS